MVCSNCGAQVGADEMTCDACGAVQERVARLPMAPAPVASMPTNVVSSLAPDPKPMWPGDDGAGDDAAPAIDADVAAAPGIPAEMAPVGDGGRRRGLVPWVTMLAAMLAVTAIVGAGLLAASRSHLSSSLTATRARLDTATRRLGDTRSQADYLQQQVTQLQSVRDDLQSQLRDADAVRQDIQKSLSSCQTLFRIVAQYANRTPPSGVGAQVASQLVSCFQGEIPPSLFP